MNHRTFLILGLLFASNVCVANNINKEILVKAFIHVESEDNDHAVNPVTKATGCLQITPIMVKEGNRLAGATKYRLSDRTNRSKSVDLFRLIMNHKNPRYNINTACRIWNPNGGYKYRMKIQKKYNELLIKSRR